MKKIRDKFSQDMYFFYFGVILIFFGLIIKKQYVAFGTIPDKLGTAVVVDAQGAFYVYGSMILLGSMFVVYNFIIGLLQYIKREKPNKPPS